jgi:hypothetical protein
LKFVRKQIYITPSQESGIKQLAIQQGTSESAILRRALDQFLVREGSMEMQDPFAELIGMFEGPSPVNHNDIYYEVAQKGDTDTHATR